MTLNTIRTEINIQKIFEVPTGTKPHPTKLGMKYRGLTNCFHLFMSIFHLALQLVIYVYTNLDKKF